jgi:ABC-type multidrug transport system permease subunit
MVIETAWNKNMFISKDMIWSSIVIFAYLALNLTLSACGHVVYVPIDFKDWWAVLYILIFLVIAGGSIVVPIHVNNWWSREITSRTVFYLWVCGQFF